MRKKIRKNLLLIIALIMLCASVGLIVSAEEEEIFVSGNYSYTINNNNEATLVGTTASGKLTLPSVIDGYTVVAIGDNFINSNENVTEVIIPESVKVIGDSAFAGCTNITEIEIPYGVEIISNSAFAGCTSLTKIEIPDSVKTIGVGLFQACYNLENIKLSNSIKTIPASAFVNCYKLQSLIIPDSVTRLEGAFYFCLSLENVTLGENVETIGDYEFWFCPNLKRINLPESLTYIGERAFFECYSLREIYLPDCLEIIGEGAFYNCFSLEKACIYSTNIKINSEYFFMHDYGFSGVTYEYVAEQMVEAYKAMCIEEDEEKAEAIEEALQPYYIEYDTPQPFGIIYCYEGSTAEAYAIKNGIDYDYIGSSSVTITPDTTNRDDFTQQHLDFVNNANTQFYNYATSDFRFANTLWENMDSGVQNTAELVYDIIEGSVEVITFQAFDGLESIENPYDVILLDFLASETTQSFYEKTVQEDAFTISVGIINDAIKMFDNDFAWAEDFNINKELKGLLNASDYSGNKLYEGLNTLFLGKGKKEVTAVFQGFECCGKILGNLSDGLSAIDCFVEMLRYTAAIEAYYNSSEVYKQVLKEIAFEMYDVNENFAEKFNDALNTYTQCVSYDTIVESILEKGLDNGLSLVQDLTSDMLADATFSMIMKAFKVGGDMAGKINAALWAVDTGFSLSNMLTGNDTLVNCRRLLRANYMLDVASYNVMKVFETTLKNKESYGAATLFDNAFSFYKNVQIYSLNMYKTYCESSSTKWLSFKRKYFKSELEETVGRIKAWNNISCHYPTEETEKTITVDTVVIACPTDVYVYRKADNRLMASVVNNKSTIYNDDVTIMTLNGDKAIAVDWLENYRIEVKATDDGKMNVSYAKYQDLQCVNNSVFETVNITDGNTYILNTDNNTLNRDNGVIIHQNGDIEGCDCKCHTDRPFAKFFFKIKLFFWKLFKKNPVCDCGVAHY